MVQAAEALLKQHSGERCCFIIRPQWSYNYSIIGEFVGIYRKYFEVMQEWIPGGEWAQRVGEIANDRIYCVSFPRVERMNVLMHANWGHEVGHILARGWLTSSFEALWQKAEASIKQRIKAQLQKESWSPKEELFKTMYLDHYVATYTKETMDLAKSGFNELLSDSIGAHLVGPAILACMSEFSARFGLDTNPRQCGNYPPWRFRLRKLSEALAPDIGGGSQVTPGDASQQMLAPYVRFLQRVKDITVANNDVNEIESDIRTREAYHLIQENWAAVSKETLKLLPKETSSPYRLKERLEVVHELVGSLERGIPPNETGIWPETKPASLPDIWNAAWAFCCKQLEGHHGWGAPDDFEDLFRLVLKAIETSYVHATFGPKVKDSLEHEHA
jgi:hypothetical protein